MPELPEVETVRRGLAPAMEGATFTGVRLNRADLRFPFPDRFAERLTGQRVLRLGRRAKYLLADLSGGDHLIMHLGMSGRFAIDRVQQGQFHLAVPAEAHTHVQFAMSSGRTVSYADPRRFGYMDLVDAGGLPESRHFRDMGPEPLSPEFDGEALRRALTGKTAPLKAALLDQRVVAGLGNIYVCEALFRARLSPRRSASTVGPQRSERLAVAIRSVLTAAVEAGGSTLRDFAGADGAMGYFQHAFDVYDRAGQPCPICAGPIGRIVQSGRSTFFCSRCQR